MHSGDHSGDRCPCGTGLTYGECCGVFHRGDGVAGTAEALMRSRFSAFALGDEAYLLRTWQAGARPRSVDFEPGLRWVDLEILGKTAGGPLQRAGTVEFRARYRLSGRMGELHENSRFVREDGEWLYVGPV